MVETPLGSVSTTPDGRHDLRFERNLPNTAEDVWRAVSSPEGIGRWLSDAEVELRPGGRFRLHGQCSVDGTVLEVLAPTLLKWTWPHPDHPASEVWIDISKVDGGSSRLALVQTNLPARHLLDVAAGWHTHLDAFPAALVGQRIPFDAERAALLYRRYAAALRP